MDECVPGSSTEEAASSIDSPLLLTGGGKSIGKVLRLSTTFLPGNFCFCSSGRSFPRRTVILIICTYHSVYALVHYLLLLIPKDETFIRIFPHHHWLLEKIQASAGCLSDISPGDRISSTKSSDSPRRAEGADVVILWGPLQWALLVLLCDLASIRKLGWPQ